MASWWSLDQDYIVVGKMNIHPWMSWGYGLCKNLCRVTPSKLGDSTLEGLKCLISIKQLTTSHSLLTTITHFTTSTKIKLSQGNASFKKIRKYNNPQGNDSALHTTDAKSTLLSRLCEWRIWHCERYWEQHT